MGQLSYMAYLVRGVRVVDGSTYLLLRKGLFCNAPDTNLLIFDMKIPLKKALGNLSNFGLLYYEINLFKNGIISFKNEVYIRVTFSIKDYELHQTTF